jgi:hypothetical protein
MFEDKKGGKPKMRRFAYRGVAFLVAVSLGFPVSSAYALREPSTAEKDPQTLSGLEEALKNPERFLRRLTQLATNPHPPTAPSPGLPAPASLPAQAAGHQVLASGFEELRQFAAQHVKDWNRFTPTEQEGLLEDLRQIQVQSDEPLETLAEYAQNPDSFHAVEPYKLDLSQVTSFASPVSPNAPSLVAGIPDWFFKVDPQEKASLQEELKRTVFILASGGGGKRFKKGVSTLPNPSYLQDITEAGRFEKPTALVHVSGKSPEVRFLEG